MGFGIFNYFSNKRNIIERNKIIINEYSQYLKNGKYISESSSDIIHLVDDDVRLNKTYTSKMSSGIMDNLLKAVCETNIYVVDTKDKLFDGNTFLVTSNLNAYKIIDNKTNKILTIFNTEQTQHDLLLKRELFNKIYDFVPKVYCSKGRLIIEEYINNNVFDTSKAFKSVITNIWQHNEIVRKENLDANFAEFEKIYGIEVPKVFDGDVPFSLVHGDFWSSNIIFDHDRYWVIDYEHVDIKYFLYDFMTYIFNEALLNGDKTILYNYSKGLYDDLLEYRFRECGLNYNSKYRKEYFLVFLVVYHKERWKKHLTRLFMFIYLRKILNIFN